MTPGTQILLEGCLTFGAPLLLAARELRGLRRYRQTPDEDGGGEDAPPPPAPKPLPACLIPRPVARARELV